MVPLGMVQLGMVRSEDSVDLLVVGGGINGTGIACDAAGRGLSVLLCEQADLGGATSSASTKLVHGGLRYLEYYEFRLVREALGEREVLLAKAPHIIRPMTFVLPHRRSLRPAWMIRIGLYLYDNLSRQSTLARSRGVNLRSNAYGGPLKPELRKGFSYADCWVDDARLVVLNAMAAAERGAQVLTGTALIGAERRDGAWQARLRDQATGIERKVQARALVNAAGPWVERLLAEALGITRQRRVQLVKGSHMVVPRLYSGDQAYILQNRDRRVVFTIPYEDHFTLIGTTEVPFDGDPAEVSMAADEAAYLCDAVNEYFRTAVSPADAVWSYTGVRPLSDDEADNPSALSRDYELELDDAGNGLPLISVLGGKITTYRRLAEAVMSRLEPYFPGLGPSWTASAALPGGDLPEADFATFLTTLQHRYPDIDAGHLLALARRHGSRISEILDDTPGGGLGCHFGAGLYAREIDYLVAHEWARTADDVLWRRTKAGLHLGADEKERVEDYMAQATAPARAAPAR